MSDAAMSKRLKNLEEFINSKRRMRDREDAVSVASQVLDNLSKADCLRSQTSLGFNKDRFKLSFQPAKQLQQSRAAGGIATITEEKASARIDGPLYTEAQGDVEIDDEYLLKLNQNTSRGAAAALISTNRRSPRYLGEYDKSDEDEDHTKKQNNKEEETIIKTARGCKESNKQKKSRSTLRKHK